VGYTEKTLLTGEWYKGRLRHKKLNGQGSYGWLDGTVYSGHWKNNKRSGYGVVQMPDGSKYEGEWQNDKLVRTFCYHNANGKVKPGRGPKFSLDKVNALIIFHKSKDHLKRLRYHQRESWFESLSRLGITKLSLGIRLLVRTKAERLLQ
jgi:hypothetical protein